ncbi:acid phosphatase [Dactylosporangium sp. McL0621]|uniref:acid phosphatase n=1 Tax=Dactylosporangium sp. McL0621 TaxID=3415678 RepID=UPI003CF3EC69
MNVSARFRRRVLLPGAVVALCVSVAAVPAVADAGVSGDHGSDGIKHIVVIYEENHSFDNLFGGWEGVDGLDRAKYSGHVTQKAADGTVLPCLPQNDVNLASPAPLPVSCTGTVNGTVVDSAFANRPFEIDHYIAGDDKTCPAPGVFAAHGVLKDSAGALPGGCTEDLVHRYYQEQYQIDGGRQDRYVAGSDAIGLTMGYYDTRTLPVYQYLHGRNAPRYVIADNFFQGAFGGSFLNHQWLVAANAPVWPGAVADGGANDLHSIVGADGSPANYPLHPATGLKDTALTQAANPDGSCKVSAGAPTPPAGTVCGDYAVNTIQPFYQPYSPGTADAKRLPPLTAPTIGDRLSGAGVDWAWYSGGWDDAAGNVGGPGWTNGTTPGTCSNPRTVSGAVYPNCPDKTFQFHHQAFTYYANYAPGTAARAAHLRDETDFIAAAKQGKLKPVSFVKPIGENNEHPGYASERTGSNHLVELLKAIETGPDAKSTAVVVTYDEFGGQWDHVSPPTGAGVSDKFGPGTRIPALIISPKLERRFTVDHTSHDTTSIIATIEHKYGLAPLSTRDAAVADLSKDIAPGEHTPHCWFWWFCF